MATVQEQIDDFKKALAGLDEFEKERLVSQFGARGEGAFLSSPKEIESPVKPPPQPGPGVGLPSLNIGLPGTGDSLKSGNESGILGMPQQEILDSGFHTGPPIGADLQTAIRDQARAAEDAEAAGAPSPQQVFLDALQSQEGQGGGRLGTAANVASTGITGAKLAGVTVPPALLALQLANTFRNVGQQTQDDKLIDNPSKFGTVMRGLLPDWLENMGSVFGLHPSVPRGGGNVFHPTPRQSEILSSDPVTLPSKRPSVAIETLPPPPITDMSSQRKAEMFNRARQLGRADPRFALNLGAINANTGHLDAPSVQLQGNIDDAPSYDPTSASFVDWDE
jgi:hypothetical protein